MEADQLELSGYRAHRYASSETAFSETSETTEDTEQLSFELGNLRCEFCNRAQMLCSGLGSLAPVLRQELEIVPGDSLAKCLVCHESYVLDEHYRMTLRITKELGATLMEACVTVESISAVRLCKFSRYCHVPVSETFFRVLEERAPTANPRAIASMLRACQAYLPAHWIYKRPPQARELGFVESLALHVASKQLSTTFFSTVVSGFARRFPDRVPLSVIEWFARCEDVRLQQATPPRLLKAGARAAMNAFYRCISFTLGGVWRAREHGAEVEDRLNEVARENQESYLLQPTLLEKLNSLPSLGALPRELANFQQMHASVETTQSFVSCHFLLIPIVKAIPSLVLAPQGTSTAIRDSLESSKKLLTRIMLHKHNLQSIVLEAMKISYSYDLLEKSPNDWSIIQELLHQLLKRNLTTWSAIFTYLRNQRHCALLPGFNSSQTYVPLWRLLSAEPNRSSNANREELIDIMQHTCREAECMYLHAKILSVFAPQHAARMDMLRFAAEGGCKPAQAEWSAREQQSPRKATPLLGNPAQAQPQSDDAPLPPKLKKTGSGLWAAAKEIAKRGKKTKSSREEAKE